MEMVATVEQCKTSQKAALGVFLETSTRSPADFAPSCKSAKQPFVGRLHAATVCSKFSWCSFAQALNCVSVKDLDYHTMDIQK